MVVVVRGGGEREKKLKGEEETAEATALCPEPSLKGLPCLPHTLPASNSLSIRMLLGLEAQKNVPFVSPGSRAV